MIKTMLSSIIRSITLGLVLCLSLLSTTQVFAMPVNFTQETELPQKYHNEIKTFWQSGHFESFVGEQNIRIHFASFIQSQNAPCLVLVPGRSEGYLKYQELVFDLNQQGYNVFIIDHRGQGLSDRLTDNRQKGYVENFDTYAKDLSKLVKEVVLPACKTETGEQTKPYLLAHSMGSTIALRMMQLEPKLIKAAVLASPMIAINSGNAPDMLARAVVKIGAWLNPIFSNQPWYFPGQADYEITPFKDNELSHSQVRYQNFIDTYQQIPELQLGGVTFHWLNEALTAQQLIFEELNKLSTPIEVLQAGSDTIVDNHAQLEFCQALKAHQKNACDNALPLVIDGAKHELFAEQDQYRNKALNHVLNWFKRHP